jgi:hypothetical protein
MRTVTLKLVAVESLLATLRVYQDIKLGGIIRTNWFCYLQMRHHRFSRNVNSATLNQVYFRLSIMAAIFCSYS